MSKFFDTWKKIYGSKVAKTTRDFLFGKDADLSDEAYREKYGYNRPIQTFPPGVTRGLKEAKILNGITKSIVSRNKQSIQTVVADKNILNSAQFLSDPETTAAALKHFNASNAERVWGEFSPAYVDWFKNFRSGSYRLGGVLKGQNSVKLPFDEWYQTVPKEYNDTTNYNLRRAYELAPFKQLEKWRINPKRNHLNSIYKNEDGDYEFVKLPNHPTLKYELDWYNKAKRFQKEYQLDTTSVPWKYTPINKESQPN